MKKTTLSVGALVASFVAIGASQAEQIVFSEVMYHPPAGLYEFVEVQNLTATPFDIANWKLRGGVDYDFPGFSSGSPTASFLKAWERIVICETDPGNFRAAYGLSPAVRVFGPWNGFLDNAGERVSLKDKNGVTKCSLDYNDKYPWPPAADGGGHSLVLVDNSRAIDDYRLWSASPSRGGTPGGAEPTSAEEPFPNPEVDLSVGIPYIDYGDTWKYNDSGADLGTAWKEETYNDASWSSGPGLFGYETASVPAPGINTPFANPQNNNPYIITYYFRKEFQFNGMLAGTSVSIDQINDDGAGYWLNGQWLGGVGVNQGDSASTGASRTVTDATEEEGAITNGAPNLQAGTNVLAVEVHQTGTGSSDIVFGARLNISTPSAPDIVINEVFPAGAGVGFVEFFNPTGSSIDIGGWYLSDTPGNLTKYQIPGSLNVPSSGLASVGFTESSLAIGATTTIYLTKGDGTTVANAFNSAMPLDGRSLGRKPDGGGSWFLFTSPTRDGANASAGGLELTINEVHYDALGDVDWVEIHNGGASTVNASGLWLTSKRDFSDKIPLSTPIGAGGVASWNTAFDILGNDFVLFLIDSSNNVIDGVAIERKPGRDHSAAWPAGSGIFYASATGSRDAPNDPDRVSDVVITELMVEPPGSHRDGEFIEIYNKGTSSIDLTSWRFDKGVNYNFPAGTTLSPGAYLVIAANRELTSDAHPAATVIGPYDGNLANQGEWLRLVDEWDNPVDEMHYSTGGSWPFLASGLGSSLELRNPEMDNSVGSSWASSDESNKSTFQTYTIAESYDRIRTGGGTSSDKELHMFAVGDAHLAIRNMSFRLNGTGSNLLPNNGEVVVTNGNASTGWLCQGTHHESEMVGNEFHLKSSGHGDNKANRCEIDVTGMNQGSTYHYTFQARWVSGKPTLVVNTWDRSFGGVIHLPVPPNLGTPGTQNSAHTTNPAPSVSELMHTPAVPTPGEAVRVMARIDSAIALQSVNLRYRLDNTAGSNPWLSTPMNDIGTGGDDVAGDGLFTVTVPQYRSDNNIVQFYVEATSVGGTTLLPTPAPERPALYVHDGSNINTDLRTQRFVMSARSLDALNGGNSGSSTYDYAFPRLSNHYFNATFIADERQIIYNCEIRKSGSPWTRSGSADLSRSKWKTPGDYRFRGYSKRSIDNDAGGGRAYHNRIIRYWLYLLGHPANENEFVRVIINGGSASLREDVEPNANDFLKRNWEDGEKGELYRIDDQWWFYDDWNRGQANATWEYKDTNEPERYHAEWIKRSREAEYDYSSFVSWVKMMDPPGGTLTFTREEMERTADIDMLAANAVVRGYVDDWDTLTRNRGKNGYFLRRWSDNRWMLAQWDSDLTFGNSGADFLGNLTGVRSFFDRSYVRQRYNYYLGEMRDKYTQGSARMNAWFQCEETASGEYGNNQGTYTNWFNSRRSRLESEIGSTALNASFNVTTGGGTSTTTSADTITLSGTSPYNAFDLVVVGHPEAEATFTGQTTWSISGIQLEQGANNLTLQALDADGNVVATDTFLVNKNGNAAPVVDLEPDPGSFNVPLQNTLDLDATASYDPEGTTLGFNWSVSDPLNANLTNPTSDTAAVNFEQPGLYEVTVTATDQNSVQTNFMREAAVFAESGWSPFTDPILEDAWTLEDVELRTDFTAGAWYSLDDRPGKLTLKINDDAARRLTFSNPTHPVLWRDLPFATDWALQTDLRMVSVQQGDFNAGLLVQTQEGISVARYAFMIEDGDFLRVKRSTGGNFSTLATYTWTDRDAVIRIRREGNQLLFDRRVSPGEWVTMLTYPIPAGAIVGDGGIFAATDTPQAARFEFDYVMVVDPNASTPALENLRLTEMMYHPAGLGSAEWIELANVGTTELNLEGVVFQDRDPFDKYEFGTVMLAPGEHAVMVSNTAAFQAEYGTGIRILGQWVGGSLRNEGEDVVLLDPIGNKIHDFEYDNMPDWPTTPDGGGPSLEVIDTEGDYGDPFNWRASVVSGGTPGTGLVTDSDADGLSDADEALLGTDPLNPDTDRDGFTDGEEVFAGTDPTVLSSRLEIISLAIAPGTGNVTATWSSVAGRTYELEASPDLQTGNWVTVAPGVLATGSTASFLDTDAAGEERRFYRVSVLP